MPDFDSFTQNLLGVGDLVESDTNKIRTRGDASEEGKVSEEIDILELPLSDEKLLKLRDEWEAQYAPYESAVAIPTRQTKPQKLSRQERYGRSAGRGGNSGG